MVWVLCMMFFFLNRLKRLQLASWNLQRLPARGTEFLSSAQRVEVKGDGWGPFLINGRKIEKWLFGKGHPLKKWALYWIYVLDFWGVVGGWVSTHLKKRRQVKLDHFARVRGENKTCLKSPPGEMDFTGVIHPETSGVMFFFATYPKKSQGFTHQS